MRIDRKYLQDVIKHCKKEYPNEACGILAGKKNEEGIEVAKVYKMKNVSDTPEICYFMETSEQFKVFKEMRSLDLELVGIYHSHINTSPYPSKRDIDLAFYEDAVYIIISLQNFKNPKIKGFKITNGKIQEVKIVITMSIC